MDSRKRVNQDPKKLLTGIECFALDMDGTVYLEEEWIDGAQQFLRKIEETGRRFVFLTNNSSKNAKVYLEKLSRMGFPIRRDQLVTSGHATIAYLKKHHPGQRVYLMGNPMLTDEFVEEGIPLDTKNPDMLVTAFDTSLTYQKLCEVCDFVRAGLPFIATHPDFNCPTRTGFIPDIGSFHALIEASTGRRPDKTIGKPNREIVEYTLEITGVAADRTAMIGDRLYTDVAAGVNNGLTGILVLSGETTLDMVDKSDVQPHLIFDSVKQIMPLL